MTIRKHLTALAVGATALAGTSVPAVTQFEGVTVDILTRPGYVIAGPLAERGKDFEKMTGAKIVVTEVPFAEIFPKIQNDWATGTNSIDVGVFAAGWGVSSRVRFTPYRGKRCARGAPSSSSWHCRMP